MPNTQPTQPSETPVEITITITAQQSDLRWLYTYLAANRKRYATNDRLCNALVDAWNRHKSKPVNKLQRKRSSQS